MLISALGGRNRARISMDADQLKALQSPLKERYRAEPEVAREGDELVQHRSLLIQRQRRQNASQEQGRSDAGDSTVVIMVFARAPRRRPALFHTIQLGRE